MNDYQLAMAYLDSCKPSKRPWSLEFAAHWVRTANQSNDAHEMDEANKHLHNVLTVLHIVP